MQRLIPAAFWAAAVFTFVSAVMPAPYAPHLMSWDKANHFIAFFVLTVLGGRAYPRRLLTIAIGLSTFGALIEVVQGLPIVHRDEDFWDWVADTLAIVVACTGFWLFRLPKSRRRSEPGR